MDFKLQVAEPSAWSAVEADALIVVMSATDKGALPDAVLSGLVDAAVASGDLALTAGRCLVWLAPAGVKAARLVVSISADDSASAVGRAVGSAVAALKSGGARRLALGLAAAAADGAHVQAAVAAVSDALYVYRHTKPSAPAPSAIRSCRMLAPASARAGWATALEAGKAIAEGQALAREVANRPGNHCTPSDLADEARKLGRAHGLKVQVLDRKACEKLGMGSFLAVARGSDEPPRFIVVRYEGGPRSQAPVVLVGKGITFDSGGISIKPAAEMDEMKFDMGGAASVLGTLKAVALTGAKVNLIGVIAACENLPSGRALKPGDVITTMAGQTVEVLNTDAEGRLILCDALHYVQRFKPAAVVDIATLTGACVIALGGVRSGLFSPDDALAAELLAAGEQAQDPAWRMPLDADYDEALKSNFADVANVGSRAAGSVTAAKFLQRFTKAYAWAHLDIAGTAWKSGAAKGATGRPVPLLTRFVLGRAASR
jgi:leucyl aminopeptidase